MNVAIYGGQWRRFPRQKGREKPNLKSICANVYTSFLVFFDSPSCFKFIKAKFKLVSARVAKVG